MERAFCRTIIEFEGIGIFYWLRREPLLRQLKRRPDDYMYLRNIKIWIIDAKQTDGTKVSQQRGNNIGYKN